VARHVKDANAKITETCIFMIIVLSVNVDSIDEAYEEKLG